MAMGRMPGALRWSAVLIVAPFLAGCPVPMPAGYQASSRENFPAESLEWLATGITTREDVLMRLGEADGAAADGSWLAYGSAYSDGGVVFVLFAGGSAAATGTEQVEYRRLVILFDERGVVTGTDLVTLDCWESMAAIGNTIEESDPCLDIKSRQ